MIALRIGAQQWREPATGRVACAALAIGMSLVSTTPALGSAAHVTVALTRLSAPPPTARAGERFKVRATIRNRTRRAVGARVTVTITMLKRRASSRWQAVGRTRLRRLRPGGSARLKVGATLPRDLRAGTYSLRACVRGRGSRANCKLAARRIRVLPALPAPGEPAPLGPTPGPVQSGAVTAPEPAPGPATTPAATPSPTATPSPSATPGPTPAGTVYQAIDGFGSSERGFDDPHIFDDQTPPPMTASQRGAVLAALYGDLGLTRVRPVQPETTAGPPPNGIEVANDNADPYATNLAGFNFASRRVDAHADFLLEATPYGATTAWNSPLNREAWMGTTTGADVAEYSEWLLAQVRRFAQRGAPLDYVSIANEPSFSRNTMSGAFIRDVIKDLAPRLAREGLLVPFVIPDDVRASNAAAKAATVLADPVARPYVGVLATHLYDEPVTNVASMQRLAETYGLPLWMSEFSLVGMGTAGLGSTPLDWARLMHALLATYDVGAIDYLWGFVGGGRTEGTLITLNSSGGTYTGFTRTKTYYYFGQYSRFVRPGALRVSVGSSDPGIEVTAYHRGNSRVIVAINRGGSPASTLLTAPDLAGVSAMTPVRTSATENWAQLAPVGVTGTSLSVTLAPGSVTTFAGTAGG